MGGQKVAAAIVPEVAPGQGDTPTAVYCPTVYGVAFHNMDREASTHLAGTEPCSLPVKPGLKSSVISAVGQKFLIGANLPQPCIQRYVVL